MIEQAHEEVRPAAGERERLEALLDAQLGATAPGLVNPEPALVRQASSWRWVTSLTVGAALVGGAALWALRPNIDSRPASTALSASAQVKPPEAAPTVASLADAQASIAPESAPSAKVSPETKAALQPAQNTLAQEVALLSRATSDLRAGRAGPALKLLDEHQRKFPNGMLTVERRAVRAQALCALKRVSEGRAELARLAPQSPAAGRAKQLCDAASASGVPQ